MYLHYTLPIDLINQLGNYGCLTYLNRCRRRSSFSLHDVVTLSRVEEEGNDERRLDTVAECAMYALDADTRHDV